MRARVVTMTLPVLIIALVSLACGGGISEAETHFQSALELEAEGRFEEAILEYDQAIGLDIRYTEAYTNRGGLYLDLARPQLAIEDSTRAIELDPENAYAYANRGGA